MQEENLIASIKRGNSHALEILVNQYKDMVFSISLKITEDYHLAEESAQDSFLKAYQQIHRFKGDSKFSTWLYRITLNTAYNKIRQRKPIENLEYHEADLISDQLSGFEKLALEDQRECINLALEQLNTLDALIISLFYMEEQSIEELEVLTGLSRSNVKVKLHRARKKLKEIMEQSFSSKLNQQ
jgi:RNA polymerase sigma factor (sigma-70 family)